jgi:putative membrane-bound dehydrogenase-like protein
MTKSRGCIARSKPFRASLQIASLLLGVHFTFGWVHVAMGQARELELENTQSEEGLPARLSAEQTCRCTRLPDGFHIGVFAAEPMVQQPIAMTFDARGRLWVAENYTYAEAKTNYDLRYRDRIVILEDTDGDGVADRRTVFWDQGTRLTSIEIDTDGVWALCAPQLLFIPDKDHNDVPDGPAVAVLDGWDSGPVRHNVVNGLRWGPDGWLYGRHGIQATSWVAAPGTSPDQRVPINCAIWRYDPPTGRFQIVCQGTTNPWGMDWNEEGELFFSNTVIGHLWHALPGAHFERMYGEDLTPHVYQLIGQTADHLHWHSGETWSDVRQGMSKATDVAGGGHAHCGLLIYQADNWPVAYRGRVLMINLHGRRINQDRLEETGSSYIARHEPDEIFFADPWFRGVELIQGPDGAVWVADWSDIGECHENDGVHRTSGRIYRIWFGNQPRAKIPDWHALSAEQLLDWLDHPNVWYARQVYRQLHARRQQGHSLQSVVELLKHRLQQQPEASKRLRAFWAAIACGYGDPSWYASLTEDRDAAVRIWAWRWLIDHCPAGEWQSLLARRVLDEEHPRAAATMVAALERLEGASFWNVARLFVQRSELAEDKYYSCLLWYAIRPRVLEQPDQATILLTQCRLPLVRRCIARRMAEEWVLLAPHIQKVAKNMLDTPDGAWVYDVLCGWNDGLAGRRRAAPPELWHDIVKSWENRDAATRQVLRQLSAVFGDGRAIEELVALASKDSENPAVRRQAIGTLVALREPSVVPVLRRLIEHRDLGADAIRGLAALGDDAWVDGLLERYGRLRPSLQAEALAALVVRAKYAHKLIQAVATEKIPRAHVTASHVRQMRQLPDESLKQALVQLWPEESLVAQREELIARFSGQLQPEVIARADARAGREVFRRACSSCHKLFGEGGTVGPDLTGAQRQNLRYLLENIIDPAAQVADNYRASTVVLTDGRVLQAVVLSKSDQAVTLQTATERMTVAADDIEQIIPTGLSLMPQGLLDAMPAEDVASLFAYLMAPAPP